MAVQSAKPDELRTDIEAMRATVKAGVQVVSAPQLFPTPPGLAARMVDLAGFAVGMRVLEPSAGTGRLLEALPGIVRFGQVRQTALQVVAVEVSAALAARLACSGLAGTVRYADFLCCSADDGDLGLFDAVLNEPAFRAKGGRRAHHPRPEDAEAGWPPGGLVRERAPSNRQPSPDHRGARW